MSLKILYSKRVLVNEKLQEASLLINDGIIEEVLPEKKQLPEREFIDYGNLVIFPGVIDAHIHINEPGRIDWEGFDTATKAAAAGGISTLVDMPLNSSPVTTNALAFQQKLAASEGKRHVHCGFWGGLIPQNAHDLSEILTSGVLGIKAFLTHSGIDEFPNVTEDDLHKAMPQIAERQMPLLVHAEIDRPHKGIQLHQLFPKSFKNFVAARPTEWENEAVRLMIKLCEKYNCPVHIVHLSSTDVLQDIKEAKEAGLPLTVETCPHYLFFDSDTIPDRDTRFKCTPPIRNKANNEKLWEALQLGLIDFVASDHSPAPANLKEANSGNLLKAWGGIIGGQLLLSATWTKAKKRGIELPQLAKWLSEKPAQFIGYANSKGKIEKGYDADLVVWNPEAIFNLTEKMLFHKHTFSPYIGEELLGKIEVTYCKGKIVFAKGEIQQQKHGEIVLRQ